MKVAVLTDAHGNLPALEVALDAIRHLLRAFEERRVPEREYIRRSFFGRYVDG
jgi:hypothetical protein